MKVHIHSIDAVMKWLGGTYDASLPDPATYRDRYFQVPVMDDINMELNGIDLENAKVFNPKIRTFRKDVIMYKQRMLYVWIEV